MSRMGNLMIDIEEVERLVESGVPLDQAVEQTSQLTGTSIKTLSWGWSSYRGDDHDDDV